MPLPLYLLAVAVFAMGTSEFMLAGLLPDIASDLDVTVGTVGTLTSAFAVGMVVGAPLVAALARDWPRRAGLLGFVLVFAAAHAVGAMTTSFPVLFATRVVAALANAGFLAVALTVAATLVPPDRKGRALAVLLSGTTVATIAGVPGGSVLGALLGWRATFWAVGVLCLPAALGILKGIPAGRDEDEATGRTALRAELAQLTRPRMILVMLLGALVNAATFGSLTFLAPVVTNSAGLGELWISVALMVFGAGSFVGVTVAGRLSDRRPGLVIAVGGPLLLVGWPTLAMLADEPAALLILVFVQGALSFALGSTLIARVLHEAAGAPTMAGSYATAALNVGAAVGPVVAAGTLGTGAGYLGPLWASGLLVAVALLIALPLLTALTDGRSTEVLR
ncbi:DHA1 family chloramphenicol resistance protein-like MFS transporter [Streptomyces sp. SAI-135]|uniref:Cmx/CmrA family chloramphenicol efflux MFS transporter n=1 Tax=unclassified Streptomyces TaxID=2593676 RepID=UPI002474DA38|nr:MULTISPECIES: Cmx/CmrA family chloramphenicol efflux MFS transporter [unclassified Streptomyces]MDH6513975.1 DHA1 family chloramphenicol resistance protein-like MFS transporter [Streptomyces sp. SAI-090]MDH6621945.1 DHA1 family chloramphenicol resistance protein-like MFS transporter [Streptomyces sp. SAI-135]